MKKAKTFLLILAALFGMSLIGCVTGGQQKNTGGAESFAHVTIVNNTGYTAFFLYISKTAAGGWEEDVLGDDILVDGDSLDVIFAYPLTATDRYDIRLEDEDGDTYTKWDVLITPNVRIVFTVSDMMPSEPDAPELPEDFEYTGTAQNAAKNLYNNIPVEVTGISYEYKDICGNRTIDNLIEKFYESGLNSQQAAFLNFTIDKFVFNFFEDGSLNLQRVSSYDQTPADNGRFYPAQSGRIHDWKLEPKYHTHSGGNCSLDFYHDIAVSQAKLNEMRSDPSLGKVYDVLLSVAEDMDYNFPAIGRKAAFVTLPNGREPLKGVCDDYSNLLISRLTAANIRGVSNIQKVTGQNHAWVTLFYNGKTLYLDATWFDTNNIDENGVVDHTPYKDPRNMTFDYEIFTNHRQHHIAGGTRNIGS